MHKREIIERIYVWDKFVRIHHWLIAILIPANAWLLEGGDKAHRWVGYTLAILVSSRIIWGIFSTGNARFSHFMPTPKRVINYLRSYRDKTQPMLSGHNPFGAGMVLVMLSLILALAITGWLMNTDAYWGEAWLQDLHQDLFNVLAYAITLHISMVFVHSWHLWINLPNAMITGYKKRTTSSRKLIRVDDSKHPQK